MRTNIIKIIKKNMRKERYAILCLMEEHEFKSLGENRKFQQEKLYKIVSYAYENVPYYRKVIRENKISISEDTIFEDIKKIPPLTKPILRKNFDSLKATNFRGYFYKSTSGGSTGEPVIFLHDESYSNASFAAKELFYSWAGLMDGDTLIRLWGSERDVFGEKESLYIRLKNRILNRYTLNTFVMNDEKMRRYIEIINKKKPKVIETYVQSVYELARFIKNNRLEVHSPHGIITSAGTLYPEFKELIEDVFQTKVYNRYGSREVGDMACSCKKDEGLHLNMFNHYVEILNDRLEPCNPGAMGQVYVTSLHNKVMPLIRYQIGDMAVPAKNEQCSCGRGLPLIEKVAGRTVDIFKTKNGELIDGEYFTHLLYFKEGIEKFQVLQKDYNSIIVSIVLKKKESLKDIEEEIEDITQKIKLVMGEGCNVKFKFVDEIPPSKSGKYLYTISEVS